ncbi:MAG: class I SAM-dependent methyltransferase [Rhizomicrobium sp.]
MDRGRDPHWMWSRYWQRDEHDDCLVNALGLAAIWRDYLDGFEDHARLLDLATGSGEAAELAARTLRGLGRAFEIDAIDAAILPDAIAQRLRADRVRVMGGVDLAALTFEDRSYDGVFSQFGIEYGSRPQAFHEAARVLRANGRGMFVMHHKESVISRACAMRLARYRDVIGPTQCFAAARQVFTAHLLGGAPQFLLQAEAKLRTDVAILERRLGVPPSEPNLAPAVKFLSEISVMPARYEPVDALRRVQFVEEEIMSWRLRQEAQQRAALDSGDIERIGACLAEAGLESAPAEIVKDGNGEIAAWVLRFGRPAGA